MILQNKNCQARHENGRTIYKYWSTDVCSVHDNYIILNYGEFQTKSTMKLMNEVLMLHKSRYRVFQKNYKWYIQYGEKVLDFKNNMKLCNTGTIRYDK